LRKSRKSIIVYLSKADILDEEDIDEFKKKHEGATTSIEEIKEKLKEIKF
jgi:hypothetical protein